MILGESGSGKELVANAIHQLSERRGRPFVAVNCGALPETLIESELFGHERGSFTGAARTHRGCFERANGGTLLSRRDHRDADRHAGAAAACARDGALLPHRRRSGDRGRRARDRSEQSRSAQRGRVGQAARGSDVPAVRHPDHGAAVARPRWRYAAARGNVSRTAQRGARNGEGVHRPRRANRSGGAPVAGERARAEECRPSRVRALRRRSEVDAGGRVRGRIRAQRIAASLEAPSSNEVSDSRRERRSTWRSVR